MASAKSTKPKPHNDPFALYEEGLKRFHSGDYAAASGLMDRIEEQFPDEIDVLARARSLRSVCTAKIESEKKGNHKPKTPEEWYDHGVVLHNQGSYAEALEYFQRALKLAGEDADFIHYAMAATTARQNDGPQALEHLKKAIELKPESRFVAAHDPDFTDLRNDSSFRAVLGAAQ
jgi:tetratricopeptide (TPR) repeat protein